MPEFIQSIDENVTLFFQSLNLPFLDIPMIFFTYLGDNGIIWILSALLMLIFKKTRKGGITLGISLILTLLIGNLLLKNTFARVRPFNVMENIELLIPKPLDYSFPSSHTISSFASATTLLSTFQNRYQWLAVTGCVIAVLISFSRIYLCVHFLSDVIAGMLIGIICGIAAILIVKKATEKKVILTKKK